MHGVLRGLDQQRSVHVRTHLHVLQLRRSAMEESRMLPDL